MTFQINIVKTAIRKSLNRNLPSISPSILSLILNDAVQYLEEYDCPPDSWEDIGCPSSPETEILSAPSTQEECPPDSWDGDDSLYAQLEGSLDSSTSRFSLDQSLDEYSNAASVSDRELDRELKEVGAKWQAYVNGDESPTPSRNRFHLYSTPCTRK